ncbi:hypothetical protein [Edwardsiella tarda]|uniref:hypothetical protein n=1 Tax=Edwardsiella tarda TaxID=636 RepID=UPI0011159DF0|nr:hypothetical protein [Edwardsiella tarda]
MKYDLDFFPPYYIFDRVHKLFFRKQHEYASRFILSSCEQWLSAEICGLINDKYHDESHGRFFCYNEDAKRDITFYICDEHDSPEIKEHVEVKLIYPLQASKRKSAIDSLINKVSTCHQDLIHERNKYPVEGWLFLVWTSYYEDRYSPNDFFSIAESEIKNAYCDELKEISSASFTTPKIVDFCHSEIKWRGKNISIIVKAIALTFSPT